MQLLHCAKQCDVHYEATKLAMNLLDLIALYTCADSGGCEDVHRPHRVCGDHLMRVRERSVAPRQLWQLLGSATSKAYARQRSVLVASRTAARTKYMSICDTYVVESRQALSGHNTQSSVPS